MAGCCLGKFALVVINLLLFIVSVAVLVAGVIMLIDADLIFDQLEKAGVDLKSMITVSGFDVVAVVQAGAIYLVVIGAILALISLCGCCGACCENKCMLGIYIAFMVVIMAAEIVLIVLAVVYPNKFHDNARSAMIKVLHDKFDVDMEFDLSSGLIKKPEGTSNLENLAVGSIQIQFECCGANNYTDYSDPEQVKWKGQYDGIPIIPAKVPASCCKLHKSKTYPTNMTDFKNLTQCLQDADEDSTHHKGCYQQLLDYVDKYANIVIGIAAGIGALELLLVIFAACICKDAKREHQTV